MAKKKSSIAVNITLGPSARQATAATVTKLKKAGLREANLLEAIGIVTGSVSADALAALSAVPDVTVEPSEQVDIPAPDDPIQ